MNARDTVQDIEINFSAQRNESSAMYGTKFVEINVQRSIKSKRGGD